MSAINGVNNQTYLLIILQIIFTALSIGLAYYFAEDYYEDVIGVTERIENAYNIKSGEQKVDKGIGVIIHKNSKVKSKGLGAKSLYWKEIVVAKRTSFLPFISISTLLFISLGIVLGIAMKGEKDGIYALDGGIAYIYFLMSSVNPIENELTKPYFYLIPDSIIKKIISSSIYGVTQVGINIILANIIFSFFVNANIFSMIVMIIFALSFYIMAIISSVLTRFIFPNAIDQKAFFPLIKMLQMLLLLLPGIIIAVITALIFKSPAIAAASVAITNIILAGILLFFCDMLFDKIEYTGWEYFKLTI